MKFSINDFSSKCYQIRRKLRIWSHLLKKSVIENFIFSAMLLPRTKHQFIWASKTRVASIYIHYLYSIPFFHYSLIPANFNTNNPVKITLNVDFTVKTGTLNFNQVLTNRSRCRSTMFSFLILTMIQVKSFGHK